MERCERADIEDWRGKNAGRSPGSPSLAASLLPAAALFCPVHKLFSKWLCYDVTLLNPAGKEAWGPLQEADRQESQVPEVRDGGILAPQLY